MTDDIRSDGYSVEGDVNLSPEREHWWEGNLGEYENDLVEEDAEYFLHQSLSTPVLTVLERSEGSFIYDSQGNEYLDFHGNEIHNVGFSNPSVKDAIKEQLDSNFAFSTRRFTNRPAIDLAKRLAEITPGNLKRSLFCPGGTDAVEMGLKLARYATGRHKTISYWDSFHGAGFGAITVGGEELFRGELGPLLPGAHHVEYPNYYRNPWNFDSKADCDDAYLHQLSAIFDREPEIAAIIAEPIRQGPLIPTERYWKGVRELCDEYGSLLIFDEICDGLGRTGTMFACEKYVAPDILVYGKSLGGAIVPNAGIIADDSLNIASERAIGHYTHEKNPLTCAASLATIDYIEGNRLCELASSRGNYFLERLDELKAKHEIIGDVRGSGLLLGVELVRDRETKEKASREAERIMYRSLEQGLSFKITMKNILTLIPPLTVSTEEIDSAIEILDESIGEESP